MSMITGTDEVSRLRSEDHLINEMNKVIDDIKALKDKCSESKRNYAMKEIAWKKIREIQKILNRG